MIFEIVEYAYPEWKAQARMSCPSTQAKVEDCEAVTRPAPQPTGGSSIDDVEIVVGEPTPLLLYSALELLPVPFHSIPVHDALLLVSKISTGRMMEGSPNDEKCSCSVKRGPGELRRALCS
jgi:hypothetical protein